MGAVRYLGDRKVSNPASHVFCGTCGRQKGYELDQVEAMRKDSDDILGRLFEDPEVKRFVEAKLRRLLKE